jgi:NAD(P)H-hydrate epimerase
MKKIITVETMRKSDAYTIENFIDSKALMLKAGRGVFESVNWSGSVAIVCGSGNNAGDGYVLALLLKEMGIFCKLFLLKEKFSDDGKYYFDKCCENNIPYEICSIDTSFKEYSYVVDCIFGTGFKGDVKGIAKDIIVKINESSGCVVAVDINSGLNGDTGKATTAVVSDLTVSIGYLKTGHFINDACKYIKKIVNCDIDIVLQGEYFLLAEKADLNINNPQQYETPEQFEKFCNVNLDNGNPVEVIRNFRKQSERDILVKNFGNYSLFAAKENTYIFRG